MPRRSVVHKEVAVVRVCGEKGASWKVMESVGKRPAHTRDVGISLSRRIKSKEVSFDRMPRKKGKQECRASGNMNRQPGSTWNKCSAALILIALPE